MPTPTRTELAARYAEVVVGIGVNVRPGQRVVVRGLVEHAELARAVAEAAYAAGAERVDVLYEDAHVRRSGIAHGASAALAEGTLAELVALDRFEQHPGETVYVRLTGNPEPHLLDDLDPAAVVAAHPQDLARRSRGAFMGGRLRWTIVAAPNPGWAAAVFGEPDVDRLWEAVATAVRLDEDDPVAAWREHVDLLHRRCAAVEAAALDAVHYNGPGTDLVLGLHPGSRWVGGAIASDDGVPYVPNLPTEEVFTSPDPTRADGTLALTRPLVMPGNGIVVEGLRLRFEGGRIVDAEAERGLDAVLAELDSDAGARHLGEVALVDRESRVRRAGLVFHDTLYDENAGAHVAWGQAFPMCLPEGGTMELFNSSSVHTDVVVGGPGVSITGVTADGERVPLIDDDVWALPIPG
jgi:aminopeptidase